ncbi:MAG: hypothetical protein ACXQT0_00175 [Candidatus Methanofastidiosia archaeon]
MADKSPNKPSAKKEKKVSSRSAEKKTALRETAVENEERERIAELEEKVNSLESRRIVVERPIHQPQKPNGTGIKVIAALLGIMFVAATAGAVYFANEARTNDNCQTNYQGLLGDYNSLSSDYSAMSAEKTALESQILTLSSQISSLTTEAESLRSSDMEKDADILALNEELDELEASLQSKISMVAYLEILMESYKLRNEDLEDSLASCLSENDDLATLNLHPYIGSYWTSDETTPTYDPGTETLVATFYIYLCVSCTDCDICYYDPCNPCDPCTPYPSPYCCVPSGSYDAIRLTVKVTTDMSSGNPATYKQSIEVIAWKWVS